MNTPKLISLIRMCTVSKSILQGKLLHQKIISLGLQDNTTLCKYLINFYFSCHLYDSARLVFRTMENPLDISLWNGLMAAYTKNFMFIEALELFEKLLHYPYMDPDSFSYPSVLRACGGLCRVDYGKLVHAHLVKNGFLSNVVVSSSLLSMYAKCNVSGCAIQVFDEMPERDVACWNAVISCYYQHGQPEKVVELFEKMRIAGFDPNLVTFTVVISSCARRLDLERGKEIHKELITSGFSSDGCVGSSLVDMYGKCGCLEMAEEVFEQIPQKNVIAWNSMISGYSLKGDSKSCIKLFRRMKNERIRPSLTTFSSILLACTRSVQLQHGKFVHGYILRNNIDADIYVNNSLIDLYFKCGTVIYAKNVFEKMPKVDVVSWNVMISGYVEVGNYFGALGIYDSMKDAGVRPDAITFTSVLPACSQLAALKKGKEIHKSIIDHKLENDVVVMGALLDMYAKCGALDEAIDVFQRLPERDLVSWTSMITAYGSHGQALEALKLFAEMQKSNEKPDGVTLLAVLSACSHAGLIGEGFNYFTQMITEFGIKPGVEHYSCLVHILGRAGRLSEAYKILQRNAEIKYDVGLLSALFLACHLYRDFDLGAKVANLLLEKDPDDPSTYIMLSNIYASHKNWHEFRKVRLKMKELGLRKNPGCSWIETNESIRTFFVEDKSHPQAETIYECLRILRSHMEKFDFYSD
ncbi:Tetratricopeptide-like helical domain containing protein [Parasponia andersonii]|uniref:Tetratricopeptide-like helical domain containing protein n=1 Tax=Parasponia andersonii TaxID=3476 RepID=A0A2P5DR73_PARAD|nr:Tetratricopeptide-like helical domain containing protein [Parasponia andersonii]